MNVKKKNITIKDKQKFKDNYNRKDHRDKNQRLDHAIYFQPGIFIDRIIFSKTQEKTLKFNRHRQCTWKSKISIRFDICPGQSQVRKTVLKI